MKDTELYTDIIKTYKETISVSKTADIVGTNTLKVRRVLITEGLWSSKTSKAVGELHKQGLSVSEIATRLVMSEKNVQSYMPYTKGMYTEEEKSCDGLRSKQYRNRKYLIADNQLDIPHPELFIDNVSTKVADCNGHYPLAIKIHLELNMDFLTPEQLPELKQYASADKSISRDVIVPADISLHALHYVIQSLFGWENSHLHHFSFPEDIFEKLTKNKLSKWCNLCGIYFRFPVHNDDDLFWEDDYRGDVSFKSWLRTKYKGPYIYRGKGDYYLENQERVAKLKKEFPLFGVYPAFDDCLNNKNEIELLKYVPLTEVSIEEFLRSISLGGEMNQLLERLTLLDYLYLPNEEKDSFELLDNRIRSLEYDLDELLVHWANLNENVQANTDSIYIIAQLTTTRMLAQSNRLNYFYDYGDGWEVSIECSEVFYNDAVATDDTVRKVVETHTPICIAADGLSVVDDVGGIDGYLTFLKNIFDNKNSDKSADLLMWAKEKGWTEKLGPPKNLL